MQFAHAGDDGLARFLVGVHPERGVFLRQLAERDAHLLLIGLGLRLDRHRDHRFGKLHPLQGDDVVGIAEGVAGGHVLQAHAGGDVAGANFLDLLAAVGVHLHQPADAFAPSFDRVVDRVAGIDHAGVAADEGQGAHEGVGGDLERQRRERRVVVGQPLAFALGGIVQHALDRWFVHRRRQVADHRVQHRLHALVLEGGAAQRRHDLALEGAGAQAGVDLVLAEGLAFQILFHQLVGSLGGGFDHLLAPGLAVGPQAGGNIDVLELHAETVFIPGYGLHPDQIDDAPEFVLGPDGKLDRHRVGAQATLDLPYHPQEIGAGAVHLVDERQPGHAVFVGLPPDRLGLRLDPAHRAEHRAGAVQYPQRTLDLDSEVHVAGGVDDVDAMLVELAGHAVPEAGGRCGGDGDAAFLLLHHPIHGGGAVVHLAQLVRDARVKQDALGHRGLAGIDVSHDAEIAIALDGGFAGHGSILGTYQR